MHFQLDDRGIVTEIHTERWDKLALGPDLEKKIETYIGEDHRDLIYFALCEKLFLKLRILYSVRMTDPRETICYWFTAPIYYDAQDDISKSLDMMTGFGSLVNQTKFADIHLESNDTPLIMTLKEMRLAGFLSNAGCTSRVVRILTDAKTSKEIALSFNIARNGENAIYFSGDNIQDVGTGKMMGTTLPYPMFTAIDNQTREIKILTEADIEKADDESLMEKYYVIVATNPHDDTSQAKIDAVMSRLKKIATQNNTVQSFIQKVINLFKGV